MDLVFSLNLELPPLYLINIPDNDPFPHNAPGEDVNHKKQEEKYEEYKRVKNTPKRQHNKTRKERGL